MLNLPLLDILVIIAYFIILLVIGFWAARHIKNQEDYFLAGRKFGKIVQTFAAFGQATSVESAVGTTVMVTRNGAAGIFVQIIWALTVPILWITAVWYRRLRLLTLGDYFEERYGSKRLAGLYAIISTVFFTIVIALAFTAMTKTIAGITAKPVDELTTEERIEYEKAIELENLEHIDSDILTQGQIARLTQLRLESPRKEFSPINETVLMWTVAVIVLLYSTAGGLEAAFLVDTLQGVCILILSLMLLPFAGLKINEVFGTSGFSGIVEAAQSNLPQAAFQIWGSPAMMDFTWYYILALLIMGNINVLVQANQLVACGSAKDEYTARFGLSTGVYMKRACTLVWGLSAFLLVILYGSIVKNPDYLYGYACRELLGSLNWGLLGLIIACLMAAMMSTVSALMITAAGLMTHNFFRPLIPGKQEKVYVNLGRLLGIFIIVGGVFFASYFDNVMQMIKVIWEFNIIMAAAFLLGIKWRGANRIGAWSSIMFALIFFGLLPLLLPFVPGVRTHEYLLKTIEPMTVTKTYSARQVDVKERLEEIEKWEERNKMGMTDSPKPEPIEVGQKFDKKYIMPQKSIFWTHDVKLNDKERLQGKGMLSLELVLLDMIGVDLTKNTYALNETIRILVRTFTPFFILIVVSSFTPADDKNRLDRFFARLHTPVGKDKNSDDEAVKLSYENPHRFDYNKLIPNSKWEFEKLDKTDWSGIIGFFLSGVLLVLIFYFVTSLGR